MAVDGGRYVSLGVGIIVLEFILVHSGIFMAGIANRQSPEAIAMGSLQKTELLLLVFYTLFAVAFAYAFQSYELLMIYLCVMVGRTMGIVTQPENSSQEAITRSAMSAFFYLGAVFVTLFVPLPELGLSNSVLNEVYPNRGSGVWERKPEIALAAGILYFTALGIAELYMIKKHWHRQENPLHDAQ